MPKPLMILRNMSIVLALSIIAFAATAPSSPVLLDSCSPDCMSDFVLTAGSAIENGCELSLSGPDNGFGVLTWTGTLPATYRVDVSLSRPPTDGYCDQMGFVLGGTVSEATGLSSSGLRVMVMSAPSICTSYPYAVPGRIEITDASDGTTQLLVDTSSHNLSTPILLSLEVDSTEVRVSADGQPLGTIASVPSEQTLTLLAFDNDDPSVFDELTVTGLSTIPVEICTWGRTKAMYQSLGE
jgi:hypothetical protein